MSEVMRAILDANCIDSRTAFYTATLTYVPPNTGVRTFALRQARVACKADVWFLAQGATQDSGYTGPVVGYSYNSKAEATSFQLQRASTGETFSRTPQVQTNQNNNLNNFVSWQEYILFKPSEVIVVNEEILATTTVALDAFYAFVTIAGIEYQMPGGWGG